MKRVYPGTGIKWGSGGDFSMRLQERVLGEEEEGRADQDGVDAFAVSAEEIDGGPGDEAEADAVGDVVGERHDDDRDEAGEELREVVEIDVF